jgi:hypothetical protein
MSARHLHPFRTFAARAAALVLVCCGACSSSSTEVSPKPDPAGSCNALASACHPYAFTAGLGRDCHELGHDGTDAACAEKKDECLAACPPVEKVDAAADADAAPVDAADAAAVDPACTALCECLGTTCAAVANYPFPDRAGCLTACASFSSEEKTCFPKWCAKGAATSSPGHACEHAWGKLGTVECDTL